MRSTRPAEVLVSAAEARRVAGLVAARALPGRGVGLVALRALPAWTFVGTYPGRVDSTRAHEARRAAGLTDGTYAVEFWDVAADGSVRTGYVLDPGGPARPGGPAGLARRFARGALAPLANEPGAGGPGLTWVWNLPRHRLELWTCRPAAAGAELTVCYGRDGGYSRTYETPCSTGAPGEPDLHVVTAPGRRPASWTAAGGNAGVRAATAALRGVRPRGARSRGLSRSSGGTARRAGPRAPRNR